MAGFDIDLCNERHGTIERRLSKGEVEDTKLHSRIDEVITAVNGKFTKLLYFFLALLVSSLGGSIGIIVTLIVLLSKHQVK